MDTSLPTLMTGPYDWDPAKTSLAEYQERLARTLEIAAGQGASALLVHGDRTEFGCLAWLTGFTPKLGPALAIFPLSGGATLLFSGGPGMVGSAKKLTWIEELRPLAAPARDLAAFAGARVALWGEPSISAQLHAGLTAVAGEVIALDDELDALRAIKSPSEIALLRRASGILTSVAKRLCDDLREAVALEKSLVSAERLGHALGAQDVRVLISRHSGGEPLPVDDRAAVPLPAMIHVAVRYGLYWAQGWFSTTPEPIEVGMLAKHGQISGIGLSLSELPGTVVCVRDGPRSAMLLMVPAGPEVLQ